MFKKKKYVQGVFTPSRPQIYKGATPIVYRSSLELKVFRWMDKSPNVLQWGSESVVVPYYSPLDGKMHRYFVDLVTHVKNKEGNVDKLLIEIKPFKQTLQPVATKRKKNTTLIMEQKTYIQNQAKWNAATKWANSKGYKFIILTEKHIQ